MRAAKLTNVAAALLLELVALFAVGRWGWSVAGGKRVRLLLALAAPALWATVWGVFLSPRAAVPLPPRGLVAGQWSMFAIAVAALFASGAPVAALLFGAAVVVNRVLLQLWHQEAGWAADHG